MRTYLLLRNNKQTGPHSLEEMLRMGLRTHDLIWVEGKSGAWRYPSELEEFKPHAPAASDQPAELPFTEIQNNVLLQTSAHPSPEAEDVPDELIEFPTLALFMKDHAEPRIEAIPRLEASDLPGREALLDAGRGAETVAEEKSAEETTSKHSKIAVSLPAARADNTLVVIQRRDQLLASPASLEQPSPAMDPIVPPTTPVLQEQVPTFSPVGPEPLPVLQEQVPAVDSFETGLPQPSVEAERRVQALQMDAQATVLQPGAGQVRNTNEWLPKLAVAAAIVSLLAVAVLVAYSIFGPDPYQLSRPAPAKSPGLAKAEARSQISKLVTFSLGAYRELETGGLSGFELVLTNGSAYLMDRVDIDLQYLLADGDPYKTDTVSFLAIAPGTKQVIQVPESEAGVKVVPAIRFIQSRELDLNGRP